jgi:hypothetical protein
MPCARAVVSQAYRDVPPVLPEPALWVGIDRVPLLDEGASCYWVATVRHHRHATARCRVRTFEAPVGGRGRRFVDSALTPGDVSGNLGVSG